MRVVIVTCRSTAATAGRHPGIPGASGGPRRLGPFSAAASRFGALRGGAAPAASAAGDRLGAEQPDEGRCLSISGVQRRAGAESKTEAAKTQIDLRGFHPREGPTRLLQQRRDLLPQSLMLEPRRERMGDRRAQSQEHRRRLPRLQNQGDLAERLTYIFPTLPFTCNAITDLAFNRFVI